VIAILRGVKNAIIQGKLTLEYLRFIGHCILWNCDEHYIQ
jgi:hypothetical protein